MTIKDREPTEAMVADIANRVTVALTERLLDELDIDEDDPGLSRWGEYADEQIAAAMVTASPPVDHGRVETGDPLFSILGALRTAAASHPVDAWQPIETAPDHRQVLVASRGRVCAAMLSGSWYLPEFRVDSPLDEAWPTHWQPLPSPPALTNKDAAA